MNKDLIECMTLAIYLEAAERITQELDARGFSTDNSEDADNLEMVIADIIKKTIQGNTNYSEAEQEDGWESDLTNQGPPSDDEQYLLWPPLEN